MIDDDKLIYEKFDEDIARRAPRMVRFGCYLGAILFPLFTFLDYYIARNMLVAFILIRLVAIVSLMSIALITYSKYGKKYASNLGIIVLLISGFCISIMIHMTGGYTSSYYAGLNIVVLFLVVIVPIKLKEAVFSTLILYLSYIVPIVLEGNITNKSAFFNNNFFLISIFIITLASLYYGNRLRFLEFKSRLNLESANKELSKLDELKSQFFSNISHEIRTPLTSIVAPLEGLFSKMDPKSNSVRCNAAVLNHMTLNAKKLLKLINDLLDFTKLEAGRMTAVFRQMDLRRVIEDLAASVQSLTTQAGLKFDVKMPKTPVMLYLDPAKIDKVFLNLLSNAIKFTPKGGKVSVSVSEDNAKIYVKVADSGIGIPSEELPKIFERFHQVDGSSTRSYGGTGIGLNLAKEFVELHKGKISAQSQSGKGTEFKVELLKGSRHLDPKQISEEVEAPAEIPRIGRNRRRIERRKEDRRFVDPKKLQLADLQADQETKQALMEGICKDKKKKDAAKSKTAVVQIVEDDAGVAALIRNVLDEMYDIRIAFDGEEGWNAVSADPPDIVISDLMMPKMGGFELTERIKNSENTKHVPVIMLTAKGEMQFKLKGLEIGADDYLAKPFNQDELKARVKSLINLRKLEAELAKANSELTKAYKDLQEAEAQLMQTEKTKTTGILLMGLAHEMNNPINHALNGIKYAIKKTQSGQISQKDVESIKQMQELAERNIKSLAELLKDFRNYSKAEGKLMEPYDLYKAVELTLKLLQVEINGRIDVKVNDLYKNEIECIPGQINQVVMNLVKNAVESVIEKGRIEITIDKYSDSEVFLAVKDSGVGMDKDVSNKIFEPFYTTKDPDKGTGLGLYLCQKIVMEHGGSIKVDSKPGKGTLMEVILPVKQKVLKVAVT